MSGKKGKRNQGARANKPNNSNRGQKFTFVQGEMTLPAKAEFVAAKTGADCAGKVKIPIPEEDDDYPDGKIAGWLVTASFAETGKAKFAGSGGFFPTATIKIPADRRSQDLELRVVGQPNETYGVCFRVTPKITNEIIFG